MEESSLRWPTDKEREEMEEVCSIGESLFHRFDLIPILSGWDMTDRAI